MMSVRFFRATDRAAFKANLQAASVDTERWADDQKIFENEQVVISWLGVPEGKTHPRVNVVEKNDFKIDMNIFTSITGEFFPVTPIETFAL